MVTGVIPRITIRDSCVARAPSLSGDVCALSGDGGVAASATTDRRTHCVRPWNWCRCRCIWPICLANEPLIYGIYELQTLVSRRAIITALFWIISMESTTSNADSFLILMELRLRANFYSLKLSCLLIEIIFYVIVCY